MSQFIFNGSSRMRNVTFARDHHKTRTSIIEDAQRQRVRREEEVRRTRAAQRLQRIVRQWLAGLKAMRLALDNIARLPRDLTALLTHSSSATPTELEERIGARLHTACWCFSYAVHHPSRIPLHGLPAAQGPLKNEEESDDHLGCEGEGEALKPSAPTVPALSFTSLSDVQAHQQAVLRRYGGVVCAALRTCAESTATTNAATTITSVAGDTVSPLWRRLLASLHAEDVSVLLYVLLQQLAAIDGQGDGSSASSQTDIPNLIASIVSTIVHHNAVFASTLDEESATTTAAAPPKGRAAIACSLSSSSAAYVDRWPAVQALTMVLELACQEPALSHAHIRAQYAAAVQPLVSAFPGPPLPAAASVPLATAADRQPASSTVSQFSEACWRCMCAAFSDDEYLMLTADPLAVLLSAAEREKAAVAADADAGGSDGCCAVLIDECFRRTAADNRLLPGSDVNGVRGGALRARVLGRLVRLLPHVQHLVDATAPYAADVVKRYLLSVSCLSERLCREPFFIESILADHYAYNTGQHASSLTSAAAATATPAQGLPRSQYRLLSSYLFSAEGGLRLLQLLTAEDEAREQLRLQALQKPTVEAPTEAAAPLTDEATTTTTAEGDGGSGERSPQLSSSPSTTTTTTTTTTTASPAPVVTTTSTLTATPVWPTSASAQQSPLEILCNVFAWPLFTFSKPDYARYQQETLALCAKLVRTPQLLRRLWSLYWQSCEGLRAVLPPGPTLQKLCAHPVWSAEEKAVPQEKVRGRRVPATVAATAPLLAALPRLPTWETHPRFPMAFFDPHPSLSIFLFTLLAHYVNVCDFADELRRGDTAVFAAVEEACALILALKEIVHRAHLYGVVPDSNGEAVAHAACLLLSRLHIVNEADPFVPPGGEGLWMSVGMVAAENAVSSIVSRWDEASAAVVDEERAAVEEDVVASPNERQGSALVAAAAAAAAAPVGWGTGGAADSPSAADAAAVLSRMPGDDVMFHGSRSWDTKLRYIKLLVHTPFLIPFPARALLLSALLASQEERWAPPPERPAVVHRGRIFVDAYDLFHDNPMSANMYNIRLISEDGTMEAGYGRGVYRECIVSLCKEGFAAEYGLFRQTADGYVFPNSFSAIATSDPQHLQKIRFLGAMVGRALRDGVLQDVPFALHFRNALLGRRNTLSNLKSFDAELYHQLMSLTQLGEEDLQAVGLTFVYTINSLGVTKEVELVRGGAQMEVTPRNCLYYVHLVADFKLNREAAEQTRAFCAGLHAVLDSNRLRLFDSNEVGKLFGGDESGEIDLQDWKENTVYDNADDVNKPQVRLFWDVVESLTRRQQSQLLKFATSMTRPPLLGFSFLSPPFKIQVLSTNVSGADHLPSAATCFSTLKLPPYRDYATARAKIIAAIEETGTFEFS
uniref:HECT-type E3 ubiquitin transferase n=1 Tax=Angomonas deanei TaxID=59799 RepID=C6K3S1_9TRYP|nr:putative ubiquitin-protein ligase [Angomonas deanei]